MCGIAGFAGLQEAVQPVLDILTGVEYRGYDSAGIATVKNGHIGLRRAIGPLDSLKGLLIKQPLSGNTGIGHTRWATHGPPEVRNSHPHVYKKVAVVHNGTIENYGRLRDELEASGHIFSSATDTEVIPHLVDDLLEQGMDPAEATMKTIARLKGQFALALLFEGYDNLLVVARKGNPLVVGFGKGNSFVGSDELALASCADRILHLEEGDMGVVTPNNVTIYDAAGNPVDRNIKQVTMRDLIVVSKGGYDHFMQSEIHQQPEMLRATFESCIDKETQRVTFMPTPLLVKLLRSTNRLSIVGCGTAGYAGLVAKYWLEELARIRVGWDIASEFRYSESPLDPNEVCLFVSQSGETADTLAALMHVKAVGHPTLAVVNVPASSIAREAQSVLYTKAGPEIGVASTKAFTTQLAVLACLSIALARERMKLPLAREVELMNAIGNLPSLVEQLLSDIRPYQDVAGDICDAANVFYVGRGTNYPIALEGALKLKEISYIHAEAFAAGELKHGPLALIEKGVPVIAVVPRDKWFDKIKLNLEEIAARGGKIIALSDDEGCAELQSSVWKTVPVPSVDPFFNPVLYAVSMQLIAYYTAIRCGKNVDKPRNLAKSVTVE